MSLPPDPSKAHIAKDLTHDKPLIACRFDPSGKFVVASSEDQSVVRWDIASGAKVVHGAHDSWVFALGFMPDGKTLLTGGGDGRLIFWPTETDKPTPTRTIDAHAGWIRSIAVSKDGTRIATAGNDRIVRLWSATDGTLDQELPGHETQVYRVGFDPTGKFLVSADLKGMVICWDFAARREARRFDAGKLYKYDGGQGVDYGGVRDFAFSPNGATLACSGLIEASNPLGAVSNPAVVAIDWASGTSKTLHRPKDDIKGVGWGIRYLSTGDFVMASGGTSGGMLLFWKPDAVNEYAKFALPNTARDLDLHPDGIRVATAHHDGHLRITALAGKM